MGMGMVGMGMGMVGSNGRGGGDETAGEGR